MIERLLGIQAAYEALYTTNAAALSLFDASAIRPNATIQPNRIDDEQTPTATGVFTP